jgi:transcription elongation GreA/GreB family factor
MRGGVDNSDELITIILHSKQLPQPLKVIFATTDSRATDKGDIITAEHPVIEKESERAKRAYRTPHKAEHRQEKECRKECDKEIDYVHTRLRLKEFIKDSAPPNSCSEKIAFRAERE